MLRCVRTKPSNADFLKLVGELDADLRIRDGEDHAIYAQYNKAGTLLHAIVAYDENIPAGSGAMRPYNQNTMEIKRMYVLPEKRKLGIASSVLANLEQWVKELGYKKCILETGLNQPEAIAFYKKNNYTQIPSFGQYKDLYNSVCFEKEL